MKNIKLITKFDYRTMKFCNLYLLNYKRKSYIMYIILTVLAAAAAVYYGFFANPTNYVMAVLFGLVAFYVVYQACSTERNLDNHLTKFFYNRPVIEQTIELDEEGITITPSTRPDEPQRYEWAFVNEIHAIPEYYMLFMGKNAPIILDRSLDALLEGTKEELDELILLLAATKPFKSINKTIVKKPITYVHSYVAPVATPEADVEEHHEEDLLIENEDASDANLEDSTQDDVQEGVLVNEEETSSEESSEDISKKE